MLVEPQSERGGEHQLLDEVRIKGRDFGCQHRAHRMADDVGAGNFQLIEQLMVEQRGIDHIFDEFSAGGFAEARQVGSENVKVAAQLFEKVILRTKSERAMKE